MKKKKFFDAGNPLPQLRWEPPKKFDEPETFYISSTPNKFFKNIYFEIYGQTINGIRERFDQADNQIYVNLQHLILKSFIREYVTEELEWEKLIFTIKF